jgi:hypothetical protein
VGYWEEVGRPRVEILLKWLTKLGYQSLGLGSEILVRSRTRNLRLYYLVFASKHELGHRFWDTNRRIEPTGQMQFRFEADDAGR